MSFDEQAFEKSFNDMCGRVFRLAEKNGFWEGFDETNPRMLGNSLMMVIGEIAEAHEVVRKHKDFLAVPGEKNIAIGAFEEEIADTIIRLMDLSAGLGLDIGRAILAKHEFNETRPFKHGKQC